MCIHHQLKRKEKSNVQQTRFYSYSEDKKAFLLNQNIQIY